MLKALPRHRTHEVHRHLSTLFSSSSYSSTSSSSSSSSSSTPSPDDPFSDDSISPGTRISNPGNNFLLRAISYSRKMHAHTTDQLAGTTPPHHLPSKTPSTTSASSYSKMMHAHTLSQISRVRRVSFPSSSSSLAHPVCSACLSPAVRHDSSQALVCGEPEKQGFGVTGVDRDVNVEVDVDVDEEMRAEGAMGAEPCNTPRPGEGGVRRRRVTVGPGMRPGRLLGETKTTTVRQGRISGVGGRAVSFSGGVIGGGFVAQAAACC